MIEAPSGAPARAEVSALILAAGKGVRLGQTKALLDCAGKTLLERAVEQAAKFADEILVALPQEDLGRVPPSIHARPVRLVPGGGTLYDTVEALLERASRPLVLLREVARPLAPPLLFAEVLQEALAFGAAASCLPVSTRDALALENGGFLGAALPRTHVVWIQTPRAYRWVWLADALRRVKGQSRPQASSVPSLLLDAGYRVRLVLGSPENVKITFAKDWEAVHAKLSTGRWPV